MFTENELRIANNPKIEIRIRKRRDIPPREDATAFSIRLQILDAS